MKLEPGMRVRCVDNKGLIFPDILPLTLGAEYTAIRCPRGFVNIESVTGNFLPERFKPVVRVKMGRAAA